MGAVALADATWADLAAAGCEIEILRAGLTAPKVVLSAPEASREALQRALAWRIEAMRARYRPDAYRALVAREGLFERGRCGSCGDAFGGGDCPLCNAARVAALRGLGVLPTALPSEDGRERSRVERHQGHDPPEPRPLDRSSPHWWACEKGHDNWGLRVSGCGPCEAARFGLMDLSALGGGR